MKKRLKCPKNKGKIRSKKVKKSAKKVLIFSYVYGIMELEVQKGLQEKKGIKMKILLNIKSNEGYAPDQVTERNSVVTVGDLKEWLEGYDDDVEIVTNDLNNSRGANYGAIVNVDECFDDTEEEDY